MKNNLVSLILIILGTIILGYVFWKVKKIDKEHKKRLEELTRVYSDKKDKIKNQEGKK
jgi:hypothetical protein